MIPTSALVALVLATTSAHAQSGEDGPWSLELGINAEPEQPQDHDCNRNRDCLTRAKAYYGGAVRAGYRDPEVWSLLATVGLTTLVDQEERPASYTAFTARIDAQVELARTHERIGVGLRLSQAVALGWADDYTDFLTDFPGFGLVVGTLRYWGELGIRTLPTPSDPRGFHLAFGFDLGRWSGTAGIGTFGTLGWYDDHLATPGARIGGYGDITWRVTERFDMRLMAVVSSPVLLSFGFGWNFEK